MIGISAKLWYAIYRRKLREVECYGWIFGCAGT